MNVYIGNWGGSSGTVWVDDMKVEEYAPFNVVERAGAPFKGISFSLSCSPSPAY